MILAFEKLFGNELYSYKSVFVPNQQNTSAVFDILNNYIFSNALKKIDVLSLTSSQMKALYDKYRCLDNPNDYYAAYLPIPNWNKMENNGFYPSLCAEFLMLNISQKTKFNIAFAISSICHEMIHYYDVWFGDVLSHLYQFIKDQIPFNEHSTKVFEDKMNLANSLKLTIVPDGNGYSLDDLNKLSAYRLNKLDTQPLAEDEDSKYEQMFQNLLKNKTNLVDHIVIYPDGRLGAVLF